MLPLVIVKVATAPLAVAVTPGPVKFNAAASLTTIVPSDSTSIKLGTVGITLLLALLLGNSTGCSVTGGVTEVVGLVVCPVPGPGVTDGGTDSGGPMGLGTVGICPVVPGPAGTGAGDRSIGLGVTSATAPVSTGAGPCVAILLSFCSDSDI